MVRIRRVFDIQLGRRHVDLYTISINTLDQTTESSSVTVSAAVNRFVAGGWRNGIYSASRVSPGNILLYGTPIIFSYSALAEKAHN